MKSKSIIIALVSVVYALNSFAQSEIDAYRIAQPDLSGTARGQAMGGAFGALGGDQTGVAINPAGLGVYRLSEFIINADLSTTGSKTNYITNYISSGSVSDKKTTFTIDNIGYVGSCVIDGWTDEESRVNFGFNFNRVKNFNRNYSVRANNMPNSLSDFMAQRLNDMQIFTYDQLDDLNFYNNYPAYWLYGLGFQAWLIDIDDKISKNNYYRFFGLGYLHPNGTLNVKEQGYVNDYDLSIAFNFKDQFYFGATLALTTVSYKMTSAYSEVCENDDRFRLDNYLNTEGAGAQLKVGVIYKPTNELRLGVSYHSPKMYALTDYVNAGIEPYDDTGISSDYIETPDDAFSYVLYTPGLWTLSAAGVIGGKAIISTDLELKNYGHSYFDEDVENPNPYENPYDTENDFIKDDFKTAVTWRLGGEYRATPQFSLRAGYAYQQQPYTSQIVDEKVGLDAVGTIPNYTVDGAVRYLTCGVGYRFTPQFSIDLAYVNRSQTNKAYMFAPLLYANGVAAVESVPADLKLNTSKFLMTLGWKF